MEEWLRGAARACYSLYRMPLPSIVLVLNDYRVRYLPCHPTMQCYTEWWRDAKHVNMAGKQAGDISKCDMYPCMPPQLPFNTFSLAEIPVQQEPT